jgi:hypothetical protein
MMNNSSRTKMDKLSDLSARLREVESVHVDSDDGAAVDARGNLVDAARLFHSSRFRFGEGLARYKSFFPENRGWTAAVRAVARALLCDQKTICRILSDFDRASQVPAEALKELEALGIDPAARKNETIISNLLTMDSPTVESAPKKAVASAVKAGKAAKAEKKAKAAKKPSPSVRAHGETEVVFLTPAEGLRRAIRTTIRTVLTNVPNEQKVAALADALEEEMYAWGERKSSTIILTPHPSTLTFDGLPDHENVA